MVEANNAAVAATMVKCMTRCAFCVLYSSFSGSY